MTATWPDRLIEGGALFLLVFTPLAYGTVQPWPEAIAELVVLGMAMTFVLGMLRHWEIRVELPPGWLPAALFLALAIFQAAAGLSLDSHATWREALKLLAVAAFFLVCYNTYRTRAQAQRALWTMIATGTLVSLFGIVQRVTWNHRLYWIGPEIEHGSPFGPFVNRAHFAGLMVVIVPMALALVLARTRSASPRSSRRHRRPRTWGDRFREWNSREGDATSLIPFLVLVMGGAALVSGSRGGVVALLAALLAMTVGSVAHGRSWSGRAAGLALVTILVVLAGVWIGGDILYGTVERLAEELERPEESTRVRLWADALGLWRDTPVLGTGLATFGVAFPRFRTLQGPVTFTHAESDWVQLLTDTGAMGLGLALAAVASLGLVLLRRYRPTESRSARALALAGLVALGGTVVQGIANYNLPVMSNFVYLALSVSLAARSKEVLDGRPATEAAGSPSQEIKA
jgi:O-antigen ligase